MGRTLMIVGPSQVGKSSMIRELVEHYSYRFVVTYATRAPRLDEIDGRDYHFLSRSKFQDGIVSNQFIEWDYFMGNYGGIGRQTFIQKTESHKVLHVLARMALRLERRFPSVSAVFLMPEDLSIVYDRIRTRFEDAAVASARCEHVAEEIAHSNMFRKVVKVAPNMSVLEVAQKVHTCLE